MITLRNSKINSLILSIILITGILFQSHFLYHGTFSQYAHGEDFIKVKKAGEKVIANQTSSNGSQIPLKITYLQTKGDPVDMNLTNSNKTLIITTPVRPYSQELVFNVITTSEKGNRSDNLIFVVQGDVPPTANAGIDRVISTAEICNSQNQNGNGNTSSAIIILDGRNSTDDDPESLKYEWTQIAGVPKIELTTPTNLTTSFQNDSICDISNQMNAIFTLKVTDSKNQTDDDNVMIVINPGDPDFPDIGFEA